MSFLHLQHRNVGLALRIALFSWLLALITLGVFVLLTIPQQKKTFLKNLASKANNVAVSLHDVAAGAAVNEDFASVVSTCQTLLAGNPDLDFLIITKNNGLSLINQQSGWSLEPAIDAYWLPKKREPKNEIAVIPLFDRRVFHHAQPFDYSGIEWGWIHVGLSLESYDQNVATLYRNTIILALGCISLSLLLSLVYARQVVRPILRLRHVVQQIAGGDLSVRADVNRLDELGTLAISVNSMTEALLRRDRVLESVRFAAQQFLQVSHWEEAILPVLTKIGQAADVGRAYVFKNNRDNTDRLCMSLQYEWTSQKGSGQLFNSDLHNIPYLDAGLERWVSLLGQNEIFAEQVSKMSVAERAILEMQNIRSIIIIPIFVEGTWWGFIGMEDCVQERIWTDAEEDSLRAGADILGATITRQCAQVALLESKNTLEQRVKERTVELQTQIGAKELALTDLAEAQNSLVESSRAAGMAEVATGVLHNVGNVLNSVNFSCTLLMDKLLSSRTVNITKVAELLDTHRTDLSGFLTSDTRGRQVPGYLISLAPALEEERQFLLKETVSLRDRIDHIKEIVAMQQSYGRVSGVHESIAPENLIEDALKLNAGTLERHRINVIRQYQSLPPIVTDKHRVLQILLNLIANAKFACTHSTNEPKNITLRLFEQETGQLCLQVQDNGEGITPENLTCIFQHGFTTRKEGHGFGLHSGALAARELGGTLTAHSDGPGLGATFTLKLPSHPGENS
jgi:two-component system, NtrC family, sensor kinase